MEMAFTTRAPSFDTSPVSKLSALSCTRTRRPLPSTTTDPIPASSSHRVPFLGKASSNSVIFVNAASILSTRVVVVFTIAIIWSFKGSSGILRAFLKQRLRELPMQPVDDQPGFSDCQQYVFFQTRRVQPRDDIP